MGEDADKVILIIDNIYTIRIRCGCGGHYLHKVYQYLRDGEGVIARCDSCDGEIVLTKEP